MSGEQAPPAYQSEAPPEFYANTPSAGPSSSDISTDELAALFNIPPLPSSGKGAAAFALPFGLVHQDGSVGAPIWKGYCDRLAAVGIDEACWSNFLAAYDNVSMASLPTSILDVIDGKDKLGITPYHLALHPGIPSTEVRKDIVGAQSTEQIVIARSPMDLFVFTANKRFFEPRRLRCRLMRGEALRIISGLPPSKTAIGLQVGRGAELIVSALPIIGPISHPFRGIAKGVGRSAHRAVRNDYATRHMAAFERVIASVRQLDEHDSSSSRTESTSTMQKLSVLKETTNQLRSSYLEQVKELASWVSTNNVKNPWEKSPPSRLIGKPDLHGVQRLPHDPADLSLWLVIYAQDNTFLQPFDSADSMLEPITMTRKDLKLQLDYEFQTDAIRYAKKSAI